MRDASLYSEDDTYVLLETNRPEQFLSAEELLQKLKGLLSDRQTDLPLDLQRFATIDEQAHYLLETSCELDIDPGEFLQWYAVRLEK